MVRVVKHPAERRSELVSAAAALFYSRGYATTSVSDIIDAVGVAKGTFYYYFDSKLAILEAMIEGLVEQQVAVLHEIVADDSLTAIPKWKRAVQDVGDWKTERRDELLSLLRMLQKEENTILLHKLRALSQQRLAPEFALIIEQGVAEGVFNTEFVAESAQIIMSVLGTFSDAISKIVLNPDQHADGAAVARRTYASVQTAIERVLGAPVGALPLFDDETFSAWFED